MARPSWPDRFLTELPNRGAIAPAARAVGVGRSTVYDEMRRQPDFKAEVERILEECVEDVEQTLYQSALLPGKEGITDRIFYLKSRKPEMYGDKIRPEQLEAIRTQVLREVQQRMEDDIAQLPPRARKIVMDALRAGAEARKELQS